MKHKILVIDDEWQSNNEPRERHYRKLESRDSGPPGLEVELEFLPQPQDLEAVLQNSDYSAYIVDVILEKWGTSLRTIWRSSATRSRSPYSALDGTTPILKRLMLPGVNPTTGASCNGKKSKEIRFKAGYVAH